ncbi:MAG: AraC family transcriptional regulator, partial [Fimbriimonadaceae bacterium]|nr:AraC family transcriptional regulator [Alphaproteobacteria bacterium]
MLVLGDLGEAILHAPTLGAALSNFSRFMRLVQSSTEMRLEIDKDCARLVYRILDPDIWPRQQDAEFSLSVFLGIFKHFLGQDWRPSSITFEHNPNQLIQGWNEMLGAECHFGSSANIITFPLDILSRQAPRCDKNVWLELTEALDRMLVQRNRRRAVSSRVKSAVFANLGRGPVDQNAIAKELGLSRRSLHRRLEGEGTRFSDILANCRMRLARQRLAHGDQSLSRLAIDLNYSDQSAFTRAFKQNCGVAPHRYRRDCQAEPVYLGTDYADNGNG